MTEDAPEILRGIAAVQDMLNQIGEDPDTDGDKAVAKILVENELCIRTAIAFALSGVEI